MNKRTTIFKQLILNIIIPLVVALLLMSIVNQYLLYARETKHEEEKNALITDEIQNIMEFQNVSLNLIESNLEQTITGYSNVLVNEIFQNTDQIESTDLYELRDKLGYGNLVDIYIINRNGIIVNTTFEKDLNFDFFALGKEYQEKLKGIFESGKFVSEPFAIEVNTRMLKKYSYQATQDKKYIVEVGVYSQKAFEIYQLFKNRLQKIKDHFKVEAELFVNPEKPLSLSSNVEVSDEEIELIKTVFNTQKSTSKKKHLEGKDLKYDYLFMDMVGSDAYEHSVMRIVSDRTDANKLVRNMLIFSFLTMVLALILISAFFYQKIKKITKPIYVLVKKANLISSGNLEERVKVVGNNEITTLSEQFNSMVDKLERSYIEIFQQKKDLEDSIKYAQRIQSAILPPNELIDRVIPDSFVLYRPKDIVSGDFYWIEQTQNYSLFAAVDCTGHGVPGAFMSIIGYNGLNKALNDKNLTAPGAILDDLNESLANTLRQHETPDAIKDGMDIALCSFHSTDRVLQYSGANNPLYVVRKSETPLEGHTPNLEQGNLKLYEIKANKQPIGASDIKKSFTNHKLQLESGDIVYIFTDGFADQFGGPRGKKFKYKPFKQLLLDNNNKSMDEQKSILDKAIVEWMGVLEQIDDICVIGVRIN